MILFTDTDACPWTIVNSNEKRRSRLAAIAAILQAVPYTPRDAELIAPDPQVAAPAARLFDKADLLLRR